MDLFYIVKCLFKIFLNLFWHSLTNFDYFVNLFSKKDLCYRENSGLKVLNQVTGVEVVYLPILTLLIILM